MLIEGAGPGGMLPSTIIELCRQLSDNLWWLLENGGPPAPVEVPVTQPPDPFFEGPVLKAMTSLIQVKSVVYYLILIVNINYNSTVQDGR